MVTVSPIVYVRTPLSVTTGAVWSMRMTTDCVAESPAPLIAEQPVFVPAVSVANDADAHGAEVTPEVGSTALQFTWTGPPYHPVAPAVPMMVGVTTGADLSIFTVTDCEPLLPATSV